MISDVMNLVRDSVRLSDKRDRIREHELINAFEPTFTSDSQVS